MAATALVIQRTAPAAATWLPDTRERCITNVRRPPETAFFGEGHRSYISVHLDRQRSYGVAATSVAGASSRARCKQSGSVQAVGGPVQAVGAGGKPACRRGPR